MDGKRRANKHNKILVALLRVYVPERPAMQLRFRFLKIYVRKSLI